MDGDLMLAWERACLSIPDMGDVEVHDTDLPIASSSTTALGRMAPGHLSEIAAGLGGLGMVPGDKWRDAYFEQVGTCGLDKVI